MQLEHKHRMTRRAFLKKLIGGGMAAAVGTPMYAYYLERSWIEIREIEAAVLPVQTHSSYKGTRIVHFSDVHFGYHYDADNMAAAVSHIEQLKPDMICFTGDFIDQRPDGIEACIAMMRGLKAPLGKYAVLGNHDYYHDAPTVKRFWEAAEFELLENRHAFVERKGQRLYIAGVDDTIYGKPDLKKALNGVATESAVILLAHEPDYADTAASLPQIKLQLSGHSHGGQIRLPIVGHLIAPPQGRKYVSGLYQIADSELQVYTNRGIGTTILPFRLFCRPEITVIELQ
ncbi:UDP-2,3-diacylglucosamine pyrophosphatase LpxG [Paenibacillus plantiphilus]|uniref:UDP-2,3-diacylglucosamine pyrophosphatase LpxG n=1 Tax=Paenibacillus plantiphilus TaxID=2905650 RepID=A0ABM9CAJ6_9BACL|nr:metallophosphoesterase [Paenibacillus plantiphilus]CAH1206814.1 UDP-2,3-diacylglucosamine pyrophosphatase LpxG [Paenibacillus plantiphilus]